MDWITGLGTILMIELIGRHYWQGWVVGLINQIFWVWLIVDHALWGLLPLTLVLIWRYTAHLIRWRHA